MTLLERARIGEITPEITQVALNEAIDQEIVRDRVSKGKIVILANKKKKKIVGIGKGLRTKVNASIGTSTDIVDIEMEVEKARIEEKYGADTLMDLSVGGDISAIRRAIMNSVSLPVGTVPLYEAFVIAIEKYGASVKMPVELLWEVIERQGSLHM